MICFTCKGEDFTTQTAVVRQDFRGEQMDVSTPVSVCTACGWQTLGRGQADELRKRTADAYRERHSLLTSAMIKYIRKMRCQNQAEFAEFLGVGEASVKRWEAGLVQEKGCDQLLRLKCAKELRPIELRRQWMSTLSATGWVSVSYLCVEGLVPSTIQPGSRPGKNRFVVPRDPAQGVLWSPSENEDDGNLIAGHEKLALAA